MNCKDCRLLVKPVWHEEIEDYLIDGECSHPDNKTKDLDECPLENRYDS